MPGARLADGATALRTDRGYSLRSLLLPLAALPSLPPQAIYLKFVGFADTYILHFAFIILHWKTALPSGEGGFFFIYQRTAS